MRIAEEDVREIEKGCAFLTAIQLIYTEIDIFGKMNSKKVYLLEYKNFVMYTDRLA